MACRTSLRLHPQQPIAMQLRLDPSTQSPDGRMQLYVDGGEEFHSQVQNSKKYLQL